MGQDDVRQIVCRSEQETVAWAEKLAGVCEPGLVIGLNGPLGAGKTRFTRAFAAALGVAEEQVNSPTYVIVQHYRGRLPLHHFDLYRLRDEDEWEELGAEELLEGEGVCLLEWSNRFPQILPADHLKLTFQVLGEEQREIEVRAGGGFSRKIRENWLNNEAEL